jgi:hypothetical protein
MHHSLQSPAEHRHKTLVPKYSKQALILLTHYKKSHLYILQYAGNALVYIGP